MRLIGTLEDEQKELVFSHFLQLKSIPHQVEMTTNKDWGSPQYGSNIYHIWIYDEDQMEEAIKWFHLFEQHPEDPIFQMNASQPIEKSRKETPSLPKQTASSSTPSASSPPFVSNSWEKQPLGKITRILLLSCCLLFVLSQFYTPSIQVPSRYQGLSFFFSPIEKALLYDYPYFYELVDRFIKVYGYEGLENPSDLPPEGHQLLEKIHHTPFWKGIYSLISKGDFHSIKNDFNHYPLFEKIREGEVWRLFSPCLLHGDLFHLFFNMLWLFVLGKQIEQRLRPGRYILFILLIGIFSNTAQYLMSGPNFIGFSGILCGMLAFIWVRQKKAAWEGYQLDRMTLLFMLIFILSMAAIQFFSFILEKSLDMAVSPNIANMAHLSGGLMGYFLGKTNFFSWRHA